MTSSIAEASYPINYREKEARELGESLKHRQSVNIVGIKRIGISNFLRFFMYNEKTIETYIGDNRKHFFIPVDLIDLVELEIYPFWTLTLKRIVDEVEKSGLHSEAKSKIASLFLNSIQSQDLFLIIDCIRQALLLLVREGYLPTIFFNRFDRISSVYTPSFFDNLQGLRDAANQELAYVFTSYRSLDSIFPLSRTSLSVFAHVMYMGLASPKDMEVIYGLFVDRHNTKLPDNIKHELFRIVNGNVQYLQLALIILTEKGIESVKNEKDLFELLIQDERITLQSEELLESLTKDERKTLGDILGRQDITPAEKEKNIYLWETGFISEKNNSYKIFSPLFENYLRSHVQIEEKNEQAIHLTKKEHLLFSLLQAHIGNICEREEIIERVWPEYQEMGISDWAIDRLVARVRVKLKQQGSPYEIVTVRTRGYKLSAVQG